MLIMFYFVQIVNNKISINIKIKEELKAMNASLQQQSQMNISKAYSQDELVNDLDPMLQSGTYRVAFYRQCPFEIRETDSDGKETGRRGMLNVRIMASPNSQSYHDIKVQISSQSDLYFLFQCKLSDKRFERIKKTQTLNFNFSNLLSMLIKLLNLCDKFPQQYTTVLFLVKSGMHQFKIVQNIEYKSIQLLALQFEPVDAQVKKQTLAFRFSLLKAKNQRIQNKTKQMLSLVKLKNLSLFQSLVKRTTNTTMGATMMLSRLNKTTMR